MIPSQRHLFDLPDGVAVAARNLRVESGQRIVMLADQFPSHVYA